MAKRARKTRFSRSRKSSGYRRSGRGARAGRSGHSRGVHTVKLVIQHAQEPSAGTTPDGKLGVEARRAKF